MDEQTGMDRERGGLLNTKLRRETLTGLVAFILRFSSFVGRVASLSNTTTLLHWRNCDEVH